MTKSESPSSPPANVKPKGARTDPFIELNRHPQYRSSNMHKDRTSEGAKDTTKEGIVGMCIKEDIKRPKITRSETQFAQGFENNAKFVISKGENDESTTIENDVEL